MSAQGKGYYSEKRLRTLIARRVGPERVPQRIKICTDTSDFFSVDYGDVALLGGRPYLVRNNEREGRFGIDDEPKFWVKRAVDLLSGEMKILKMVFHEKFRATVGDITFECVRSPRKEARILELVKGHPNFMQGFAVTDEGENIVRVIDFIPGRTLADHVLDLGNGHEEYFYSWFPYLLGDFIGLVEAVKFLHDHGEKHGDIRRDHIIKDKESGICRWIDFDFNYMHGENISGYDLFGLGNVLAFLVGHGDVTLQKIKKEKPKMFLSLREEDLNIIFGNRIVNLRKIYPYIPEDLNLILLHFSRGANVYYENTEQFLDDLRNALEQINSSSVERGH